MGAEQSGSMPNAHGIAEAGSGSCGRQSGLKMSAWVGLFLALFAGAVFWAFLRFAHPIFQVPQKYYARFGDPAETYDALRVVQADVDRRNAMVDLGVFGLLIAGALALGESVARRSVKPLFPVVPIGAGLGCLAGLAGSMAHASTVSSVAMPGVADTIKVHTVLLGLLGLSVGLALGISAWSIRTGLTATVAGLLAGLFAAVLYPMAMGLLAMFVPALSTYNFFPTQGVSCVAWIGLTAGLLGLIIPGVARSPKPRVTAAA